LPRKKTPANLARTAEELVSKIREKLPKLAHLQATDLQAALKNDPAASGLEEILLSYPALKPSLCSGWPMSCTS